MTDKTSALLIFDEAMRWLRTNYQSYTFFVERDLVWTMQTRIASLIRELGADFRVSNDYAIEPGNRRSLCVDLAVLRETTIELATEWKFEPSHRRIEIAPGKLPVCSWGPNGVRGDVDRISHFVEKRRAQAGHAILVDEGGYFRGRPAHVGAEWVDWP
ncbi:MAG: hypothetical protein WEC75_03665 [Dehalococcoidia bacterium]